MPSLDINDTEVTEGSVTHRTGSVIPGPVRDLTGTTVLDTATNSTLYYHDGSSIAQVLSKGTRINEGSKGGDGVGNSCWHITTKISKEDAAKLRDHHITTEVSQDHITTKVSKDNAAKVRDHHIFQTLVLGTKAEAPQGELEEVCLWADFLL